MADPNRPTKKNAPKSPAAQLSASDLTTPLIPTAFPVSSFIANFPSGAPYSSGLSVPNTRLSHSQSSPDLTTVGSASRRRYPQQADITSHEQFPTLAAGIQVKHSKRRWKSDRRDFDEEKAIEGSGSGVGIAETKRVETEKVDAPGMKPGEGVPVPSFNQQQTPTSSPRYLPTNPASQAGPSTSPYPQLPTGNLLHQGQYPPGPFSSVSNSPQFETANSSFQAGLTGPIGSYQHLGLLQAGPPTQTRPSPQPGPSTFTPPLFQATTPSLQNPFQPSPSISTASPFYSQAQSPATMAENTPQRPARWAMSPDEVDRCIFNIMNNLNPLYSTDVFTQAAVRAGLPDPNAMLRTSLAAQRAGAPDPNAQYWSHGNTPAQTLYADPPAEWEDLDPPTEPIYLTEAQHMKLGFAIHKLGPQGLRELIEFTRYVCLRSLMAAWEEPDINKIWHKYNMKGTDLFGGLPYSLNRKVQILMTHIERAEEHCAIQLQKWAEADMAKRMATLTVDQQGADDKQGNGKGKEKAVPSHENNPPGNATSTDIRVQEPGEVQGKGKGKMTDKKSPGKSSRGSPLVSGQDSGARRLTNVQLDQHLKSFATILQLAGIWNKGEYAWYVDTLQDFGFPKMMRSRHALLESDMHGSFIAKWAYGQDSAPVQNLRGGRGGAGSTRPGAPPGFGPPGPSGRSFGSAGPRGGRGGGGFGGHNWGPAGAPGGGPGGSGFAGPHGFPGGPPGRYF
ncbi:hypothetical protein TWF506_010019 [Arthrobotrys conoides]|uniref:Uncharacterized protein n=1 Tax=Arthrobotrys conoides TaxID=74498 RepID=A0AAN8NL21_9PEZI